MRKTRSDSKLARLDEGQQAQLVEWLLGGVPYHQARELVKKEFGLSCSISSLSYFYRDCCAPHLLRRRNQAVQTAEDIAQAATATPGQFDQATIDAIKQKAFELAINPMSAAKDVKSLFMLLQKSTDQSLKREQLKLDRERFEFDAAQACLAQLPNLQTIARNPSLDERAKIDAIRTRLFGTLPPEQTTAA